MRLTVINPERETQDAREVVGQLAKQQQLRARRVERHTVIRRKKRCGGGIVPRR